MKSKSAPRRSAAATPRSGRTLAAALLPLLAAVLPFVPLAAQTITSAVPGLIAYQGKVTTAAGALVGAGTPVNRIVIFRIWDHASNSTVTNLVYSEQQTVTISEGEFSVLVGQGTAVTGTPLGYSESSKGPPGVTFNNSFTVFGGSARFLGVTVDDGTGAVDPEVSPRQQIVTSAYAFRARYAEGLGSNGGFSVAVTDQGNFGVGLANPTFPLTTAATLGTKLGLFGNFNYGIGIQASQVQIFGASSGDDVVFGYGSSAALTETMRVKGNGNIGIGTNSPQTKLDVNGVIGVFDGGVKSRAAGIQTEVNGAVLNFGVNDSSSNRFGGAYTQAEQGGFLRFDTRGGSNLFSIYGRPAAGTGISELMALTSAGNLGLGVAPTEKLHVSGNALVTGNVGIGTTSPSQMLQIGQGLNQGPGGLLINTGWINSTNYAENRPFDVQIRGTSHLVVNTQGNVGIGTSTPEAKLHVFAPAATTDTALFSRTGLPNTSHIHYGTDGDIYWRSASSSGKVILQDTGGRVGIGTASPSAPLHVNGSGGTISANLSYYVDGFGHGGPWGSNPWSTSNMSIIASNGISAAAGFFVVSDARTKNIVGESNGAADLETLGRIRVTDFSYIDPVEFGRGVKKRVIAQQVEEVYPQAVNRRTEVIPDILKRAEIAGGWIKLTTNLKAGDRVCLVSEKGGREVHEVLEVQADRFRTASQPTGEKVFVYGREVKDFRSVDYDAIAMLNVSATQEIKREKDAEVAALRAENAALRDRLTALEAQDRAREAKLASIEKLLQSGQTVMARPASRTGAGEQE